MQQQEQLYPRNIPAGVILLARVGCLINEIFQSDAGVGGYNELLSSLQPAPSLIRSTIFSIFFFLFQNIKKNSSLLACALKITKKWAQGCYKLR